MTSGILVDTHIFLWARAAPAKLTEGERRVFDAARIRYVSIVTFWEIAILLGLRRIVGDHRLLNVPDGSELLPVRPEHCELLISLPRHHRDPFDRMLIAQAHAEAVPLLTRDRALAAYGEHATVLRFPAA